MKIAVLAGGKSTERNVSLSSGSKITNALRSKGYDATMIDLFFGMMNLRMVKVMKTYLSLVIPVLIMKSVTQF